MKKWFEDLKIAKKLSTGFLLVVLLSVIIGGVGIISILSINSRGIRLYREGAVGLNHAGDAAVEYMQLRYNAVRRLSAKDQAATKELVNSINGNIEKIDASLESFRGDITAPELLTYSEEIQKEWDIYKENMTVENEAALNGETVEYNQEIADLGNTLKNDFEGLFDLVSETAAGISASNSANATEAVIIMIVVIIISVAISLVLSKYISDIISIPVRKYAAIAELTAVGDMDISKIVEEKDRLWALRKDEIGMLAGAFDRMISSTDEQVQKTKTIADGDLTTDITIRSEEDVMGKALTELVEKFHSLASAIVSIADQVSTGAAQVSDGAQALSSGATEQAATVEELNASIASVADQASQNASNVQRAAGYMDQASQGVLSSNEHMQRLNTSMREIGESSREISKITKLVEDIAFQTNILALNAAVEAARAGNAGKGFAVVADEVRNLAAKSAEAAKQTSDLIQKSVTTVLEGERLADESLKLLLEVSEKSGLVEKVISEIEEASTEQAASIEQINEGLSQVSAVVQTNAATAEESSAASEELAAQAQVLQQEVGKFRLNKESGALKSSLAAGGLTRSGSGSGISMSHTGSLGKY
ncbi:MAG: methyl-accepting chemotaxis protein [Lachnospiraceae bacterium]